MQVFRYSGLRLDRFLGVSRCKGLGFKGLEFLEKGIRIESIFVGSQGYMGVKPCTEATLMSYGTGILWGRS